MGWSALSPSTPAETLHPPNAAFMGRTGLRETRLLGFTPFNLDAVTTLLMGLLGRRPAVRHVSGATDPILRLLERAGLRVEERLLLFSQGDEAEAHARSLVDEGFKLFSPYPLRAGQFPPEANLVPPDLWRRLNAKANIEALVPAEHLAPRRLCRLETLSPADFERAVFLKDAGSEATGWGYAVRYCSDAGAWAQAIADFRGLGIDAVVIEDALDIGKCWCVALAIQADDVHFAGAAEQVFASPGKQSGSLIDEDAPFPAEGVRLAKRIGDAARRAGFLGLAGLDIGLTRDGALIVFDPNFRFNASSPQVLLHRAAVERVGHRVSASVNLLTPLAFATLAERLTGPIDEGWFVPTRFLDGAFLPAAQGRCAATGFVTASHRMAVSARCRDFARLLEA